jgi:diguanylate cyclase (GGDEF)-like protein
VWQQSGAHFVNGQAGWNREGSMNISMHARVRPVSSRAMLEERYWSVRRQVPIVYLLGVVNLSAMELAATRHLSVGLNLPTFVTLIACIRLWQWFGSMAGGRRSARKTDHKTMIKRLRQTIWFSCAVCLVVCARCIYLLEIGDAASRMAVMLFGGLTAIGVAYGFTAYPAAGRVPLLLIIGPLSIAALLTNDPQFAGAAFGLVVVATLTLRLIGSHSRHFNNVVHSRSEIAREQERLENARREAVIAATTDFLTGLPNRRAFVAALDEAARKRPGAFALAVLDLNRFKAVNDTFGHATGDQLLQEVSKRLVAHVDGRGLVARLGGDEFGILFHDTRRARQAHALGVEIVNGVNGPALIGGRELAVSLSCGIAVSRKRQDGPPSRLLADADLALYQAKRSPAGGVAMFELKMEAPRLRRGQIESALQLASVRTNLGVVFQPIFDLRSGRIIAHEALGRWTDPVLGAVGPSEFVPIAEQLNLIDDINHHLMGLAFEAARTWSDEVKLSINLSAIQICTPGCAKAVLERLKAAGLGAERLQIEVTETALLADFERARKNLTELRKAGATIVLDDFGAGFASIGYLRELRFDQIKLDGGLVTAAQHHDDGKRLLKAVVGLCDILGVSSIAEHVESKELLSLVIELGCTAGQGFWLAPPLGVESLTNDTKALLDPPATAHRQQAA